VSKEASAGAIALHRGRNLRVFGEVLRHVGDQFIVARDAADVDDGGSYDFFPGVREPTLGQVGSVEHDMTVRPAGLGSLPNEEVFDLGVRVLVADALD
jgi:hypothetical protein